MDDNSGYWSENTFLVVQKEKMTVIFQIIQLSDILLLGYWLLLIPASAIGVGVVVGFAIDKRVAVHEATKRKCRNCHKGDRGRHLV
jgi:hypothetical protein